jgi:hypothetical protein
LVSRLVVEKSMPKGARTPPFTSIAPASSAIEPPRKLGQHGLNLWNSIQAAYHIADAGGVELLALACAALDRVESLAEQIAIDGEVIRDGEHPPKAHPALRDELAGRAFVARTLERLGVTAVAPTAPAGLPGKSWRGF